MGLKRYEEYTCDRCGAVDRSEGYHIGRPKGWGCLSYAHDGGEGENYYCPNCVKKQYTYIAYTPETADSASKEYELTPERMMALVKGVPPEDVFGTED